MKKIQKMHGCMKRMLNAAPNQSIIDASCRESGRSEI
jgi:hypothetical protein